MTIQKQIDLKPEEMEALLQRISSRTLKEDDYEIIHGMGETIKALSHAVNEKRFSIHRLKQLLFGSKTESKKNISKEKNKNSNDKNKDGQSGFAVGPKEKEKKSKSEKNKGHGRNGASQYTGADNVTVSHCNLKSGDICNLCNKGKLYNVKEPGTIVKVIGKPPVCATVYKLEKLRCNLCGKIFTADLPKGVDKNKYDTSASAIISMLKYGNGLPFYRLEGLQNSLGIPLATSTQWDIVEKMADKIYPAFNGLIYNAAQGEVTYNDDTPMKIINLMKENNQIIKPNRTGIFTTGILSKFGDKKIVLFFTGRNHAGENMIEVLKNREKLLSPPIQMCDGASRNHPKELMTILANCLSHGRRYFVDIILIFPDECQYVIDIISEVYKNDKLIKEQKMTAYERLIFHQENSGPVMKQLKNWLQEQFDEKKAEPNSSMGKAISYMLNHWEPLTLFLRKENAPLDNNLCEQALKRAILHRKNSMFYKTEHGAFIGDLFMSIIHTCKLNAVNPFDYLVSLCKHSSDLFKNPQMFMPWNYKKSIIALS